MPARPRNPGAVVPAVAFVTFLAWDLLRVWLPLVLARSAALPSGSLWAAAFALATVLVAAAIILLLRPSALPRAWITAVTILALVRIGVQHPAVGMGRLLLTTVGFAAAVFAIAAIAGTTRSGAAARLGILVGIAASASTHAILGSVGLQWRTGPWVWAATLVLVAATLTAAWSARQAPPEAASDDILSWILLAPILLLVAILVTPPGRVAVATGWHSPWVAATTVVLCGLVVFAAVVVRHFPPRPAVMVAVIVLTVGTIGALRATTTSSVLAQAMVALGCGLLSATPSHRRSPSPRRVALAAWGALLGFAVLVLAYHAPYGTGLGYRPRTVLLITAAALALAAAAASWRTTGTLVREQGILARATAVLGATAITAVLAGGAVSLASEQPVVPAPGEGPVRVLLYDLGRGLDADGTTSITQQAEVIAAIGADIIVLNDVDRGWFTTGGRDTLRILQAELGLPYLFAPAADDLHGNAIMSRYPVVETGYERLPRGRDTQSRSQLVGVLEVEPGAQLAVVATRLSDVDVQGDTRIPQARAIAATAARLRDRRLPVVIGGDLYADASSPELASFGEVVTSVIGLTGPSRPSWPVWGPRLPTTHVLVSSDVEVHHVELFGRGTVGSFAIVVDIELLDDGHAS